VEVAQRHNLLLRCVKKELDEHGEPTCVRTFPLWHATASARAVEEYGCSVAVSHLLRFYRQAACLLLVLLLAALFPMLENYARNAARNECRAALRGSFGELTGWPAATERAARCGLAGVDVKQDIGPVPAYLMTGLGTCQEYSNATGREPVFGISAFEARVASFEPLAPNATACTSRLFEGARLVSYWADTLAVLLVLGFLILLRRSIVRETRLSDERQLTTGDYAVMITGLKRHCNPDDEGGQLGLESLLRQDLVALGFKPEAIDHVEVGRECAEEAACLRRLAALHVRRQELQAKRASSHVHHPNARRSLVNTHGSTGPKLLVAAHAGPAGGGAAKAGGAGACARAWRAFRLRRQRREERRLEQSIGEGERQIQRLLLAEHRSTGHAFVVFKEEQRRAEFVALFFRPKDFEPYMARLHRRACSLY